MTIKFISNRNLTLSIPGQQTFNAPLYTKKSHIARKVLGLVLRIFYVFNPNNKYQIKNKDGVIEKKFFSSFETFKATIDGQIVFIEKQLYWKWRKSFNEQINESFSKDLANMIDFAKKAVQQTENQLPDQKKFKRRIKDKKVIDDDTPLEQKTAEKSDPKQPDYLSFTKEDWLKVEEQQILDLDFLQFNQDDLPKIAKNFVDSLFYIESPENTIHYLKVLQSLSFKNLVLVSLFFQKPHWLALKPEQIHQLQRSGIFNVVKLAPELLAEITGKENKQPQEEKKKSKDKKEDLPQDKNPDQPAKEDANLTPPPIPPDHKKLDPTPQGNNKPNEKDEKPKEQGAKTPQPHIGTAKLKKGTAEKKDAEDQQEKKDTPVQPNGENKEMIPVVQDIKAAQPVVTTPKVADQNEKDERLPNPAKPLEQAVILIEEVKIKPEVLKAAKEDAPPPATQKEQKRDASKEVDMIAVVEKKDQILEVPKEEAYAPPAAQEEQKGVSPQKVNVIAVVENKDPILEVPKEEASVLKAALQENKDLNNDKTILPDDSDDDTDSDDNDTVAASLEPNLKEDIKKVQAPADEEKDKDVDSDGTVSSDDSDDDTDMENNVESKKEEILKTAEAFINEILHFNRDKQKKIDELETKQKELQNDLTDKLKRLINLVQPDAQYEGYNNPQSKIVPPINDKPDYKKLTDDQWSILTAAEIEAIDFDEFDVKEIPIIARKFYYQVFKDQPKNKKLLKKLPFKTLKYIFRFFKSDWRDLLSNQIEEIDFKLLELRDVPLIAKNLVDFYFSHEFQPQNIDVLNKLSNETLKFIAPYFNYLHWQKLKPNQELDEIKKKYFVKINMDGFNKKPKTQNKKKALDQPIDYASFSDEQWIKMDPDEIENFDFTQFNKDVLPFIAQKFLLNVFGTPLHLESFKKLSFDKIKYICRFFSYYDWTQLEDKQIEEFDFAQIDAEDRPEIIQAFFAQFLKLKETKILSEKAFNKLSFDQLKYLFEYFQNEHWNALTAEQILQFDFSELAKFAPENCDMIGTFFSHVFGTKNHVHVKNNQILKKLSKDQIKYFYPYFTSIYWEELTPKQIEEFDFSQVNVEHLSEITKEFFNNVFYFKGKRSNEESLKKLSFDQLKFICEFFKGEHWLELTPEQLLQFDISYFDVSDKIQDKIIINLLSIVFYSLDEYVNNDQVFEKLDAKQLRYFCPFFSDAHWEHLQPTQIEALDFSKFAAKYLPFIAQNFISIVFINKGGNIHHGDSLLNLSFNNLQLICKYFELGHWLHLKPQQVKELVDADALDDANLSDPEKQQVKDFAAG